MYWFYWEDNGTTPEVVNKIKYLIKKKLKNYIIVTPKTIRKYIEIVDISNLRCIAQKVDYFRAKLLYKYGGIWLDMDTIILEDIDYLYDQLLNSEKEVMISISELNKPKPNVCLAYLISKPGSTIFKIWYKLIENVILKTNNISYGFFGNYLATIINKYNLSNTILPFPNDITFRFGCKNYQKYYCTEKKFIEDSIDKIEKNNYKLIILYGSSGLYNHKIDKNSMLFSMFKYADNKNIK
jgi:mannosyltransferase OCH1-like enzyme